MRFRVRRPAAAEDDFRAVVGLILLAAVIWTAPIVLTDPGRSSPPEPRIIYSVQGAAGLLWSPTSPSHPPRADGFVRDPAGRALGPVGGWQGLLLGNPLELNGASQTDLEALPGIGPRTAVLVLEKRHGLEGFRSCDDLLEVRGIGPKTLERLRLWVEVRCAK